MQKHIHYYIFLFLLLPITLSAQLFQDNFGTGFASINTTKWPCNGGSSFNTSVGECASSTDRAHYIDQNEILATQSMFVPSTGYCLNFDYSYNSGSNLPKVQVGTGGTSCSSFLMTWTDLATLAQAATCTSMSFSLDAYAGQTIYIRFVAGNSFTDVMLDDVVVDNSGCSGGGGGTGADMKWADNFNDNDLNLNYAGLEGDETCTGCGTWSLSTGATLELTSLSGVTNQTEAFADNMANVRYVKLDRDEFIESPTIDLSGEEGLKISFYARSSSIGNGGDAWSNFSDHLRLQIWDGSAWITVKDITQGTSTEENKIASGGFNYFCFTAYKNSSSPGNYYYTSSPNVNSAYFHSDFKFRVVFEGGFSGAPFAFVDNFTFRADDDGYSTMVPCGLSFWNEPDATGYGQDPGATALDDSERGVNLELDNSISFPPNWTTEANDGDQVDQVFGSGESERVVFAVISEQRIQFSFPRVSFTAPSIGNRSTTMSLDNTYTGPGYRYYAVEYISCDLAGGSISEPTDQFGYHYVFEYGNEFIPVFYHLNSSGIQTGGGATSSFERFDAPDVTSTDECGTIMTFPVEWTDAIATYNTQKWVDIEWTTATEINSAGFELERSLDGINFEPIAWQPSQSTNGKGANYAIKDENVANLSGETIYYRLRQIDSDGQANYSKTMAVSLPYVNAHVHVYPNPVDDCLYIVPPKLDKDFSLAIEVTDVWGKVVDKQIFSGNTMHGKLQLNTSSWAKGAYAVQVQIDGVMNSTQRVVKY
ncbi:MAG: T9SS type A sorting domain-containing protein [Aureispira sp.]|nr:T9SS type A sorting domain-containing protein [Aureispira sp.]